VLLVTDRRQLSDYIRAVTSDVHPEPVEGRRPRASRKMRPEPVEGRSDGLVHLANLPSGTSPMAPNDACFAYLTVARSGRNWGRD
jgi:hypothetical protein